MTKLGQRCKHPAREGGEFCSVHLPPAQRSAREEASPPRESPQPRVADRPDDESGPAFADNPFASIADAMSAVADQLEREQPARDEAQAFSDPPSSGISNAVYNAAYLLGFGVAMPVFFGLSLLPPNSAAARGLRDGARDAKRKLRRNDRDE